MGGSQPVLHDAEGGGDARATPSSVTEGSLTPKKEECPSNDTPFSTTVISSVVEETNAKNLVKYVRVFILRIRICCFLLLFN